MKNKNNDTHYATQTNLPKLSDPNLWDRIRDWHQTLSSDKALTARIAATGVLKGEQASSLILEYLRFAYLAWTMPGGATPSKSVDEAWHAHLLFTRSYDRFCEATRGERLHHDPGDGDEGDAERFEEAYAATLARYEAEFGPSPDRWWPKPAPKAEAAPVPVPAPAPAASSVSAPMAFVLGIAPFGAGLLTWAQSGSGGFGLFAAGAAFLGSMAVASAIEYENTPPEVRAARAAERATEAARRRRDSGGSSGGDGGLAFAGADGCGHGGGDGGGCGDGGSSCGGGGCGGGGCGGG